MLRSTDPSLYKGAEKAKDTMEGYKKAALTLDEQEARENTYLEQVYGAQAERDAAAHQAAVKAQETARKEANRREYIGNELMQRYLPQYQAMQGTAGMGTSSTDALAVYNAYLGRVSGNNAAYAQNVAALDQQKAELDFLREAEKREAEFDVRNRYEDERQQQAEKESDGLLLLMAGKADGYYGTDEKISQEDYDNLLAFYRANENRLTEAGQRNALDALAEYREDIRSEEEQRAMDRMDYVDAGAKVSKDPGKYEPEKKFEIKDADGKVYHVQIREEVVGGEVLDAAHEALSGDVFSYGGQLYFKENGRVYSIERRTNSFPDDFTNLYNLYMGRSSVVPVSTETDDYVEGSVIRVKNQYGKEETVTVGEREKYPTYPQEYMETGVVYNVNGERIIKDASGVIYKVK